jgi:hypothetical protein
MSRLLGQGWQRLVNSDRRDGDGPNCPAVAQEARRKLVQLAWELRHNPDRAAACACGGGGDGACCGHVEVRVALWQPWVRQTAVDSVTGAAGSGGIEPIDGMEE